MDQNDPQTTESREPNSAIIYMVSIYLLLIAFFVIMHTISEKEEVRTAAVVGSLQVTFQRPDERTIDLPSKTGQPRLAGPNEQLRERVESIFGAFLDTARYSMSETGNVLRVTMPVEALFYAGSATLRADRLSLVREIATMVAAPQSNRRNMIAVDFEIGAPIEPGPELGQRLEIRRAGALARDLERRDVDASSITVGILDGRADTMRISFAARARDGGDDD